MNFQQKLEHFVLNNPKLVSMKETSLENVYVLKYKKNVFYNNAWNEYLEECRGTLIDKDFNIIARPFTKIYNYGVEDRAPKLALDTPVVAYRKVNGFMVALTWSHEHQKMIVSTTGSIDSPYVTMAKEMMATHAPMSFWENNVRLGAGYTLMFECCHPNDPHIIPEKSGMYFLGWRENTWDSKVNGYDLALRWSDYARKVLMCYSAEPHWLELQSLLNFSKKVEHEGYVFYTKDTTSAKIKTPYYLTSKFVSRNPKTDKLLRADIKKSIDEEYHKMIDKIQENIVQFTAMNEQERLSWVREFLEKQ